jgi:hypothetical protein
MCASTTPQTFYELRLVICNVIETFVEVEMKLRDFLETWSLSGLKIKAAFLEADFAPKDVDRYAAWDLYVELLTRVSTQYLSPEDGDESTALQSIHSLFPLTREILRKHGSGASEFAKLAISVLNQIIRPFTAKWHRIQVAGGFGSADFRIEFRQDLVILQNQLRQYTKALADLAQVEDLTSLDPAAK